MKKFFKDESGATAIEYGLIAAAMGLALVTAMPSITSAIETKFSRWAAASAPVHNKFYSGNAVRRAHLTVGAFCVLAPQACAVNLLFANHMFAFKSQTRHSVKLERPFIGDVKNLGLVWCQVHWVTDAIQRRT